ncbi:MAG: cation diffusion facilitator family transporter [Myxococcales bacterium]|nr:cation diffusion facilitator family transporter [Myxococcales bacterium]MDP3501142.1 cation diffusion facilitator family transporter [Myxococcales bacterium]
MSAAPSLKKYVWLSIAAAVATIGLKGAAWALTGSVGLLSDALESFVNLAGALMALWMMWLSEQPADEDHAWGHGKAEYFSSAFEGFLIFLAAVSIAVSAVLRLMHPKALEAVAIGLGVSVAASVINFAVSRVLAKVGKAHHSVILEADAHHLMTDVWTSVGVIVGVGLVAVTGWLWLDPVLALLVAANILFTGWRLMKRSASGLMDEALPPETVAKVEALLEPYRRQGLDFHALRTRQAGSRAFVTLHVLVPGSWTVKEGHDLVERIEVEMLALLPNGHVTTHLEPLEDPVSMLDEGLDRRPHA